MKIEGRPSRFRRFLDFEMLTTVAPGSCHTGHILAEYGRHRTVEADVQGEREEAIQ